MSQAIVVSNDDTAARSVMKRALERRRSGPEKEASRRRYLLPRRRATNVLTGKIHGTISRLHCATAGRSMEPAPGPGTTRAMGAPPPLGCCIMASRAPLRAAPRSQPGSELRGRPLGPAPCRSTSSGP